MPDKVHHRLKRLSLQFWMLNDEDLAECTANTATAEAVVGKPGIYRTPTACWFELADGRAFAYDPETFDHRLATLEAGELLKDEAAAVMAIARTKLATPRQRMLAYHYDHHLELRRIGRNTRKVMLRILRED